MGGTSDAGTAKKPKQEVHMSTLPAEPLEDGTKVIAELRELSMRRASIIFKRALGAPGVVEVQGGGVVVLCGGM